MMKNTIWNNGMFGLIVGDALGVPVEFTFRSQHEQNPVTGMRAYGTHSQPAGSWSDDSSMALATLDSLRICGAIDYKDIMDRFNRWLEYGEYTPYGRVFDRGITCTEAILRYRRGISPCQCGGTSERDNGNGSLMRILPVCLWLYEKQKQVCTSDDHVIYILHNISALTHGHIRSQMACGIYFYLVKAILDGKGTLKDRLQKGMNDAFAYYRRDLRNLSELAHFSRIADMENFKALPKEEIKSGGYVVHTLEASLWCLLNTDSFRDACLAAVNLGSDTDTTACVAGGLAGLFYGIDAIPSDWMEVIAKRQWIEEILSEME